MTALATILLLLGAFRLAASLLVGDDCERRSALSYLVAGAVAAAAQL